MIKELRKLKESSKEAVENVTEFSSFKKYMHVKRKVEDELIDVIKKSSQTNKSELILVCGGVGDGKSHIISYIKSNYPGIVSNFNIHNDATESFDPGKTSIDTLNDVLDPFCDEKLNFEKEKLILAINLGALSNFIDSKYGERFTILKKYVEDKKILELDICDSKYDSDSRFSFINFSDYHIYSLTEQGPKSDYLKDLINKITQESNKNTFYKTYESKCRECICEYKCPVKANYQYLSNDSVQNKVNGIVTEAVVKDKLIISTRSILNFFYDLLVSVDIDSKTDDELISYIQKLDSEKYLDSIFTSNLYEHKELSPILASISNLDPITFISSESDSTIIGLNITDDVTGIFKDKIDIRSNNYIDHLLTRGEIVNKDILLCENAMEVKDKLINTFIRIKSFIPSAKEPRLKIVYDDFMINLYHTNKGEKRKLSSLYKDVKEAIFKWNGDSDDNLLNVNVGKNQIRYKVSSKVDLEPYLNNIVINDKEEIDKFNQTLDVSFKESSSGKVLKIEIDYNLYELLMKVKKGYRPNVNDKYNYIKFVEFINKINKAHSKNKDVFIEDKTGIRHSKYKLSYDSSFEEFKFQRIGEN
ncbi:MAG: DNA phosphorothioation-dependent restriction protein DptF [Clostridium sp.]